VKLCKISFFLGFDAGASPAHQASQCGSRGQLEKPAQILKMLWNCCADLK